MQVKLVSFGFKYGPPYDVKKIVDCRPMKNPHNVTELRRLTGLDGRVQKYVETDDRFGRTLQEALLGLNDGDTVAFGCYGGRHRSVAMVEMSAYRLRASGFDVEVHHRELDIRRTA
ncbi:RNase adapter RapZ [Nitratireductor sp. OM-1]|uniref:RapZ C-terminal domain-containing protein n=1 Tax=Nitratireductor sp. OM-1 TaxID=1756988 RepID=UPI000DDE2CA4|nr:RNase adapter RapZ [Nitratireductor sp. OM-1]